MAGGWIKLHRQLRHNGLWNAERFSRGQAWVDLLLMANYESATIFMRGCEVCIKRGQMAWSKVHLAERWRWNERSVTRFLLELQKRQMIQTKSNNITTIITIRNFNKYQNSTEQNADQNTEQNTEQSTDREEVKEDLKKNKEKTLAPNPEAVRLAELLLSQILTQKPDLKKPNVQTWAKDVDRLIRLDKRTPERVEAVIRWYQQDAFWHDKILSVRALRKHFDTLESKMRRADKPLGGQVLSVAPDKSKLKQLDRWEKEAQEEFAAKHGSMGTEN